LMPLCKPQPNYIIAGDFEKIKKPRDTSMRRRAFLQNLLHFLGNRPVAPTKTMAEAPMLCYFLGAGLLGAGCVLGRVSGVFTMMPILPSSPATSG
jgi:hypothetical protein